MKALIYDIEIKNAILGKGEVPVDSIKYCAGWGDHANMGISVIGAYDYHTDRYRVFCDDNKEDFFEACEKAEILVTFNGLAFDDRVIQECWNPDFPQITQNKSYDVLTKIWIAAELNPKFGRGTHIGYSLDAMCKANFGTEKSGNGALAPILWQQGEIGSLVDYCLNDVKLTRQCFDKICAEGYLISPKDGQSLLIEKPAI